MTTKQNNSDALLQYLLELSKSGQKDWFGFSQQRVAGIDLVYRIAANHADKMTPKQITAYVNELNNCVYLDLIKKK